MIWIIGEYAERIDNADELLESFLDSFQDENTQVCSRNSDPFKIKNKYSFPILSRISDRSF